MSEIEWLPFLGIFAAMSTPFLFYWFTHREQMVIDLSVDTEHHPDCLNELFPSGTPRLEEQKHDHMVKISLRLANKGAVPIRIREIEATGITDKPRVISSSKFESTDGVVAHETFRCRSLTEELLNKLPEVPLSRGDPAWSHEWNIIYTGCEKQPSQIKIEIKTDRKTHKKKIENCIHESI